MTNWKLNEYHRWKLQDYKKFIEKNTKPKPQKNRFSLPSLGNIPSLENIPSFDFQPMNSHVYLRSNIYIKLSNNQIGLLCFLLFIHSCYGNETQYISDSASATLSNLNLFNMIRYEGLPIKNISGHVTNCHSKHIGISAGKVCLINGIKHVMKAIANNHTNLEYAHNGLICLYYNKFVRNNLEIKMPIISIAYQKNGVCKARNRLIGLSTIKADYYTISKWDDDFKPADTIISKDIGKKNNRKRITDKIGEDGLVKIIVASTFFYDMIENLNNWGFDSHGLMIVDADLPYILFSDDYNSPEEAYYSGADVMLGKIEKNFGITLSLRDVMEMKSNYLRMAEMEPPQLHRKVNLSANFYRKLIDSYSQVCDDVIQEINIKNPALLPDMPSHLITREFQKNLRNYYTPIKNMKKSQIARR
ncbi:hypothetical protein [Aquicella lusitana]|nr:hypothetical protein [Aquicella lusitana]